MSITLGGVITVNAEWTLNGAPSDPTTVNLFVYKPDGSTVTHTYPSDPEIVKEDVGKYYEDLTPDAEGLWRYRWEGIGNAQAAFEGEFVVESFTASSALDYSYDTATDIGQVRLYIDDRDLSNVAGDTPLERRTAIFSDAEIQIFLNAAGGDVFYAVARALVTIANNRQLLVQSRRIGRTSVDYGSIRRDLLAQAESFVSMGNTQPADGFAEVNYDDFTFRRIIINEQLRNQT